jgi:UDP-N-acetylglucosamine 4,6-dehydratase
MNLTTKQLNILKNFFSNKTILVTGGTGSFGKICVKEILQNFNIKKIIIFSRDEQKQFEMQNSLIYKKYDKKLRFFIGDIRDFERFSYACGDVDIIIHAAALKHVSIAEYNPMEFVATNINGSYNVIKAAIANNVNKTILLSTDKAVSPVNLYGATKLAAEKLFIAANNTVGNKKNYFSSVRYGNVIASRGSIIEKFLSQEKRKDPTFTITDKSMSRFWISLEEAVAFVWMSILRMQGGEIFIPKITTMRILDLSKAINKNAKIKYIGVRPGEKIKETLISLDECVYAIDFDTYYLIAPQIRFNKKVNYFKNAISEKGKKLNKIFEYNSEDTKNRLKVSDLENIIKQLKFTEII